MGSGSIMDLTVQKQLQVQAFSSTGTYLGVIQDIPKLVGTKDTLNSAQNTLTLTLPRQIDAFVNGTIALQNRLDFTIYGPGISSSGLLKWSGTIDTLEATLDDKGAESIKLTLVPPSVVIGDHGRTSTLNFTSVDPINIFTYFFTTNDATPGVGGVKFTDPLTLAVGNATSSGLTVNYTTTNLNLKSIFDTVMLMLGPTYYWRPNPDKTVTLKQLNTNADHTFLLGQHIVSLTYSSDNSQRKNVIYFQGATGVSAFAYGASAAPISSGGLGERLYMLQDSRITDNTSAQVLANGALATYDQTFVRAKIRIADYRGDSRSQLGYDIETLKVGDTVTVLDARGAKTPTGTPDGGLFNQVMPVTQIDYMWDFCDVYIGTLPPNADRALTALRRKFSDFTLGS